MDDSEKSSHRIQRGRGKAGNSLERKMGNVLKSKFIFPFEWKPLPPKAEKAGRWVGVGGGVSMPRAQPPQREVALPSGRAFLFHAMPAQLLGTPPPGRHAMQKVQASSQKAKMPSSASKCLN